MSGKFLCPKSHFNPLDSLLGFVVCVLLMQHGLVYETAVILSAGAIWKHFFPFAPKIIGARVSRDPFIHSMTLLNDPAMHCDLFVRKLKVTEQ